ncbi:MAG: hypothetical protein ABJ308_00435 [Halieaceae bacterium]
MAAGADRIAENILDRELAPLLSRELGLPVTLEPVKADLLGLKVRTTRLLMGAANDPAIVATNVMVGLNWTDLLRGKVRLAQASGEDLSVKIASWPSNDNPWPSDYYFLDQWLPNTLTVTTGRYIRADGSNWPITTASWRRHFGGSASLAWQESRPGGKLTISTRIKSLSDLLGLKQVSARLQLQTDDKTVAESDMQLTLARANQVAYQLQGQGKIAGIETSFTTTGSDSWAWPDKSKTQVKQLRPGALFNFLQFLFDDNPSASNDLEADLATNLADLDLPSHQGQLAIDEIRIGNESTHDNTIGFSLAGQKLTIDSLRAEGPSGSLNASGSLNSRDGDWGVQLDADIHARDKDASLAAHYVGAKWYWQAGHLQLGGNGTSLGALLDSLTGDLQLKGAHHGQVVTPVELSASLDNKDDTLELQGIALRLGKSQLTGTVGFSGGKERLLTVDLQGNNVDLKFLTDEDEPAARPGFEIPVFLTALPGVEINWQSRVQGLELTGISLAAAEINLQRKPGRGTLVARIDGHSKGKIKLQLDVDAPDNQAAKAHLRIDLESANLGALFEQELRVFDSRATGSMVFNSQGDDAQSMFKSMRGDADVSLELRTDANWARQSGPEETLRIAGVSSLVIDKDRITGVKLEQLKVDSIQQNLTGTVSLVAGRSPWLVAAFNSERFDIDQLLDWLPTSADTADQDNLLQLLRELGPVEVTFAAKTLRWLDEQLDQVILTLSSGLDSFTLEKLDFGYDGTGIRSKAGLKWRGDQATLHASGEVSALSLGDFLPDDKEKLQATLQGKFSLNGEGASFADIIANIGGSVRLASKAGTTGARANDSIELDLQRISNGVEADLKSLVWQGSDIKGKLRYQRATPTQIDLQLSGSRLNLLPWEETDKDAQASPADKSGGMISSATRATSKVVVSLFRAPARLVTGGDDAEEGQRLFSAEQLDLELFRGYRGSLIADIDEISTRELVGRQVHASATLKGGDLSMKLKADYFNGGSSEIDAAYTTSATPPMASIDATFTDMYAKPDKSGFPRSGVINVSSSGTSEAELAANINGTAYIEFGKGPLDYGALTLLTTDAATGLFRGLIPGAEKQQPQLNCAVTLFTFKDGVGITPYGYAARTNTANLLGRIEADMENEQIKVRFQSRSREGVGISVGNAFSNTVSLQGPFSDPKIVTNTTGLVARGWAAFMTAGISLIGESMFNRVLASANPCQSTQAEIRKDICGTDQAAAASPLVCPPTN